MADPTHEITPQAVRDEICREILRVHEESYGGGARDVNVHLLDDIVLVLIDTVPTTAERTLIDAGHSAAVQQTREAYQAAIAPTFKAIVERATGRKVNTFLSRMSVDPPMFSVELFRLGG
jgi:uncharacterized protein YbcI